MPRYLTKSRFLLGIDCPSKLYYTRKNQYPDKKSENEFLEALAKGGYQVGALAKCYYPDGYDIETLEYEKAVEQTNELLEQESVVLFEAAFQVNRYFIRVDILEKKGNEINLIEVKSKSFQGNSSLDMLDAKGNYLNNKWRPYVYDVAFQKHVLQLAKPEWNVKTFLMLADKTKKTTVDGLNQKFLFREAANDRTIVDLVGDLTPDALGEEILIRVNVDDLCEKIFNGTDSKEPLPMPFFNYCQHLADHYWNDQKIVTPIHKDCGKCEFQTTEEEDQQGKRSGYMECFSNQLRWVDQDFLKTSIFDIWDFRRKQDTISQNIFHLDDVKPFHIGPDAEDITPPLTRQGRQWLQIIRTRENNPEPFIDLDGLKEEISHWVYPLHMIDFETSTVAIPFYRGMKPYETVSFQFSHHTIQEDGTIEHSGEYLNVERGFFPNFELVRRLKDELTQDQGSVFRYADHENTVLNHIKVQLQNSQEPDRKELIEFIETITHVGINQAGDRDMIDLLEVVKKHYWHPTMKGSNSLKAVLPAILRSSLHIQDRFSKPIYGSINGIRSKNYSDWCWIQKDAAGEIISPYKLLPSLFEDLDGESVEELLMGDRLADGGAAMTAYAMMQFIEMSEEERDMIVQGLLKYCELDTMAMVFLYDFFKNNLQ